MVDYTMTDEEVKEWAGKLEEGTLDAIRQGIPVPAKQAAAAIAYRSLQPKKKPTVWQRVKNFFWRGY